MGEDVKHPMRGLGLSSLVLQDKKALVNAVSVAVEAILAQFSSSRTIVQKALSGDSSINPSLGRLVLQCLCPALHSLLTDGLKPHQSDLIAGRRPNSAWGLVQASTRPGPKTQALFNLQVCVGELPQLRQSKHRFNAFLLGLLNTKLLDFWLSHLQSCSGKFPSLPSHSCLACISLTFISLSLRCARDVLPPLLLYASVADRLPASVRGAAPRVAASKPADLQPRPALPAPPFRARHSHSRIPSTTCQDAGFQQSTEGAKSKTTSCRYIESLSGVDFGSPEYRAAKNIVSIE
uniref:RUN and SH3 domain containing 1 n=1 Tax=Cyclopterus lumpus TaxID=8103 RepID=A0A8C2WFA5_CYCLU